MVFPTHEELDADHFGKIYLVRVGDGIAYMVRRCRTSLCAYVGVPPNSPLYGLDAEAMDAVVDVHGGFTYSARWDEGEPNEDIPVEVRGWWWFGWDYAHGFDEMLAYAWTRDEPSPPGLHKMPSFGDAKLWMLEDVIPECERATREVSRVLVAMKKGGGALKQSSLEERE